MNLPRAGRPSGTPACLEAGERHFPPRSSFFSRAPGVTASSALGLLARSSPSSDPTPSASEPGASVRCTPCAAAARPPNSAMVCSRALRAQSPACIGTNTFLHSLAMSLCHRCFLTNNPCRILESLVSGHELMPHQKILVVRVVREQRRKLFLPA